jgi:hypothetical protein
LNPGTKSFLRKEKHMDIKQLNTRFDELWKDQCETGNRELAAARETSIARDLLAGIALGQNKTLKEVQELCKIFNERQKSVWR